MRKDPYKLVNPLIVKRPDLFKSPKEITGRNDDVFFEMVICHSMVHCLHKNKKLNEQSSKDFLTKLRKSINGSTPFKEDHLFTLFKIQDENILCLVDESRGVYPLILTGSEKRINTQGKNIASKKAFAARLKAIEDSWSELYPILFARSKGNIADLENYRKMKNLKTKISNVILPPPRRSA